MACHFGGGSSKSEMSGSAVQFNKWKTPEMQIGAETATVMATKCSLKPESCKEISRVELSRMCVMHST